MDYGDKKILKGQEGADKGPGFFARVNYRKLFKRISVVLTVAATVGVCAVYSGRISGYVKKVFDLKMVAFEITGTRILNREALAQEAGLGSEANLFHVRLDEVKDKLSKNPYVKDVEIIRSLPEKLEIKVVERKPFALLEDRELIYLDEDGVPFKSVDIKSKDRLDFPVITGVPKVEEDRNSYREKVIAQALYILKEMVARKIARMDDISEVNFCEIYGFSVYFSDKPLRIIFGLENIEEKFSRLSQVLQRLNNSQGAVSLVDLDYGDRAIVRLKGTI